MPQKLIFNQQSEVHLLLMCTEDDDWITVSMDFNFLGNLRGGSIAEAGKAW